MILVRDLIKQLEILPPDLPVLVAREEISDAVPLEKVESIVMIHCRVPDEPSVYFNKESWDETWSGIYNRIGKPWEVEPHEVKVAFLW
jgi:hypothetical protein